MAAPGLDEENQLREAGFSSDDIEQWRVDTDQELSDAGFSGEEIDEYFGRTKPDVSALGPFFQKNLQKNTPTPTTEGGDQGGSTEGATLREGVEPAKTFLEAIEAGWEMSVTGLITREQAPDTLLPEDAPMFYRIASQVATLAGDVPAMVGGALAGTPIGASAGAIAGPVGAAAGAVMGGGAGAFAMPTFIRETLMQGYEKGDIKSFQDFWERASHVFLETSKAGVTGAATMGAGAIVGKIAAPLASAATRSAAVTTSEIATMVTVGKALEGQVPQPQDFLDAAIVVAGLKGSISAASKLRTIYARTGVKPSQVAQDALKDPTIKQDLASKDVEVPKAYEDLSQQTNPTKKTKLNAGKEMETQSNVLTDPDMKVSVEIEPMPEPKAKTAEPPVRSEAENQILSRVSQDGKAPKEALTWEDAYRRGVDALHPIKKFEELLTGGKIESVKDSAYDLARLSRGSYGKADQAIQYGTFDFNTLKNKGPGLAKILEPFKEDLDGFRAFAVSARALELKNRGIETGVDAAAAEAVFKAGSKKYKKAFEDIQEFQNHNLEYLRDSGILSEKSFKKMKEMNKAFVPFYRVMEEGPGGPGGARTVRNPVKGIKGSEREIVDPIESMIKNTYTYMALAERNRVGMKMVELWEKAEKPEALMQKVPTAKEAIEVKSKEVIRALKEQGIEIEEIPEAFTIFRGGKTNLAKDEVAVFRDGSMEVYRVPEPVAEAVRALDGESANLLIKILAKPAQMLRAGTTILPEFAAKNFIRDQITAFNLSKNGFMPVIDTLRGLGGLLKKDSDFQNWLKAGGANAAMVSIDRHYIQENVFKLAKETKLIDKTWNVVKSPFEMLRVASELIENSTRLGEFKAATRKGKDPFQAAFESREVTLDFARMGAQTKAINMVSAFWNVGVQGVDRTVRAFRENPVGMAVKVGASITLPSVLLWAANHDDPRWKEIPQWQKDFFWIVMTKDHVYRIPKPFEVGLMFGSLPERALEAYFTENPKALEGFAETIFNGIAPGYMPTFATPLIEHFANKSTFTGAKIIPGYLEGVLPEYQYSEYTSEAGKILGKMVAAVPSIPGTDWPGGRYNSFSSPAIIENYIRGWTGGTGSYVLKTADWLLTKSGAVPDPVKPAATLADIPVIKAFTIRYPAASAQSIQDFYDRFEKNEKVIKTVKMLAKSGDFDNVRKELFLNENQDKLVSLSGIQEALGTQSKFIRMIHKNKTITPDEKRQLIDGVYYQMIESARLGNQLIDQVEKAMKER